MTPNANRRAFMFGVAGAFALIASPKLIISRLPTLWGDGVHDDTVALQALVDGEPVKLPDDTTFRSAFEAGDAIQLQGGTYVVGRTIHVRKGPLTLMDLTIDGEKFSGETVMNFTAPNCHLQNIHILGGAGKDALRCREYRVVTSLT